MAGGEVVSELREMELARLSICKCGYAVLHDSIPLGTVYHVDINTIRSGFHYRCGGCGVAQDNVEVIDAAQRSAPGLRPLPLALFSPRAI